MCWQRSCSDSLVAFFMQPTFHWILTAANTRARNLKRFSLHAQLSSLYYLSFSQPTSQTLICFFLRWDISVICLTVVLKLAEAVLINLYFQTFIFFNFCDHFKIILVYDRKKKQLILQPQPWIKSTYILKKSSAARYRDKCHPGQFELSSFSVIKDIHTFQLVSCQHFETVCCWQQPVKSLYSCSEGLCTYPWR